MSEASRRSSLLVAAALALLVGEQVARVVMACGGFASLLSPDPSWIFDYPLGTYVTEAGVRIFHETGRLWGYEPHFMAGYPLVFLEHNMIGFQVLRILTPELEPGLQMRLVGLVMMASLPLLFYGSARLFGISWRGALASTAIAMGLCTTGELYLFLSTTPVLGGWASLLLLPVLGLAFRFLETPRDRRWMAAIIAVPAAVLFIHKGALVVLPVPLVLFFAALARRSTFRPAALAYVGSAVVTLAVNAVWAIPLARYLHVRTDFPAPMWQLDDPLRMLTELIRPAVGWVGFDPGSVVDGSFWTSWVLRLGVTVLGVAGLIRLHRDGRTRLAVALAASLAYLAWLSYFGSAIGWIARTEPYRYVIVYRALLLLGGAFALDAWLTRPRSPRVSMGIGLAAILAALAPFLGPSHADLVPPGHLSSERPAEVRAVQRWIEEEAPSEGRLMIEDSSVRLTQPSPMGGGYAIGMLVLESEREIIGGRVPYFRVPHRFANFLDGEAFGLSTRAQHPERLRRYLELYDITAIAAWHPESRAALDDMTREVGEPAIVATGEAGAFATYRVEREADAFERGSGRVEARWGALELRGVVASEQGDVVLRYHWMEGLEAQPSGRVEAIEVEDDPVPFLRIVDPPTDFRISLP